MTETKLTINGLEFRNLLNDAPAPACLVCGKTLEQKPRFSYAAPFEAPREWCPDHGYRWEQAG